MPNMEPLSPEYNHNVEQQNFGANFQTGDNYGYFPGFNRRRYGIYGGFRPYWPQSPMQPQLPIGGYYPFNSYNPYDYGNPYDSYGPFGRMTNNNNKKLWLKLRKIWNIYWFKIIFKISQQKLSSYH